MCKYINLLSGKQFNYFDLIIIGIILFFFIIGGLRGTIKSFISLGGFFVTAIISIFLFHYIASLLLKIDFVKNLVYGKSHSFLSLFNNFIGNKLSDDIGGGTPIGSTLITEDMTKYQPLSEGLLKLLPIPLNIILKPIINSFIFIKNSPLVGYTVQTGICAILAFYMYLVIIFIFTFVLLRIIIKILEITLLNFKQEKSASSFVLGGLLGAINGAFIAIIIFTAFNFAVSGGFLKKGVNSYNDSYLGKIASKIGNEIMHNSNKAFNVNKDIKTWLSECKDDINENFPNNNSQNSNKLYKNKQDISKSKIEYNIEKYQSYYVCDDFAIVFE